MPRAAAARIETIDGRERCRVDAAQSSEPVPARMCDKNDIRDRWGVA